MMALKHINVISAAKIFAIVNAIIGFVIAVFIFIFTSLFGSVLGSHGFALFGRGAALLVILPVFLLVMGFVVTAIETWLYNLLAKRIGGIKIDLSKNRLKGIDLMSAAKIYAAGGAIVGLVAGIIFAISGLASGSSTLAILGLASIVLFPLLFALVFFVVAAIGIGVYNFVAYRIGGIKLFIKGGELKSIGAMSYAKIEGIFGAIVGLVEGAAYTIGSVFIPASFAMPVFARSIGALSIIAYPIFYFVLSFVVAFIGAWLYNTIASRIGGIKVVLSQK